MAETVDNIELDKENVEFNNAAEFVECDKILGYHFDTFGYIEINHEEAKRKFFEHDKDLMLLNIGESIEL